MLIDSQLTKQWLDEWLDDNSITKTHLYEIKAQIVTYQPGKLQIGFKYDGQAIHIPGAQDANIEQQNLAGVEKAVINWLQQHKQIIEQHIRWINFIDSLEYVNEFRERKN